jgi:hypothetical protein
VQPRALVKHERKKKKATGALPIELREKKKNPVNFFFRREKKKKT